MFLTEFDLNERVEIIMPDGSTRTATVEEFQPVEPSNYVWAPFWTLAYTDRPDFEPVWMDTSGEVFHRNEDGSDEFIGVVAVVALADWKQRQLEDECEFCAAGICTAQETDEG